VATVGFYASIAKRAKWAMTDVLPRMAVRFEGAGLRPLPEIDAKVLRKMNLPAIKKASSSNRSSRRKTTSRLSSSKRRT
jgi:hypothetical protein